MSFDIEYTDDDTCEVYSQCPGTRAGRGNAETWTLRAAMREVIGPARRGHISDRHPHTANDIFAAIRADWGNIGERRLWRILWWLLGRGYVVRVGDPHTGASYVSGYAIESRLDYIEREHCRLGQRMQCLDCQGSLPADNPVWCGHWCKRCKLERMRLVKVETRARREANALCVHCGKHEPEQPFKRCRGCLDRYRAFRLEWMAA